MGAISGSASAHHPKCAWGPRAEALGVGAGQPSPLSALSVAPPGLWLSPRVPSLLQPLFLKETVWWVVERKDCPMSVIKLVSFHTGLSILLKQNLLGWMHTCFSPLTRGEIGSRDQGNGARPDEV